MVATIIAMIVKEKEKQMEKTDKIVLREANITSEDDNYPNRVNVRACTNSASWKNITIQQCKLCRV